MIRGTSTLRTSASTTSGSTGGCRATRPHEGGPYVLLGDRSESGLLDRERPIEVRRFDHDVEDSRVVGRVGCSFSDPLFVDGLLQRATADGALQNQFEPA